MRGRNGSSMTPTPHIADAPRVDPGADHFSVTVTRTPQGYVLVNVLGELDMNTVGVLRAETAFLPADETNAVVLDLSRVTFLAAEGIELLVDLLTRSDVAGVPLALVVDTRPVRRPLEALGLAELFPCYVDRVEAFDALALPGHAAA